MRTLAIPRAWLVPTLITAPLAALCIPSSPASAHDHHRTVLVPVYFVPVYVAAPVPVYAAAPVQGYYAPAPAPAYYGSAPGYVPAGSAPAPAGAPQAGGAPTPSGAPQAQSPFYNPYSYPPYGYAPYGYPNPTQPRPPATAPAPPAAPSPPVGGAPAPVTGAQIKADADRNRIERTLRTEYQSLKESKVSGTDILVQLTQRAYELYAETIQTSIAALPAPDKADADAMVQSILGEAPQTPDSNPTTPQTPATPNQQPPSTPNTQVPAMMYGSAAPGASQYYIPVQARPGFFNLFHHKSRSSY
jgi:hypothetical protein